MEERVERTGLAQMSYPQVASRGAARAGVSGLERDRDVCRGPVRECGVTECRELASVNHAGASLRPTVLCIS